MKIRLLSEQVAAKIAAGEVVERPVSVVKEIVENSLDAGATQVLVEIRSGGVGLIRVVDNGMGMESSEAELAFLRHATSKLASAADLESISTLGFRGEALSSIAAVSRVHLVTRPKNRDQGWEIVLEWGRVQRKGPRGSPPGTSISVSDLFENVPARRNFLRSTAAEAARINELVSRYAMAYPEVRFQLIVEGRDVLKSSGSGRMADSLTSVYGAEVAKQMLDVLWEQPSGGNRVEGYISPPSLHRSNRRNIIFYVNRRCIQSRLLSVALEESYHGLLPQRRYPLAVVNITVPYGEIDVNVHPTKREVRFRHGDSVFSALQRAARAALMTSSPIPQVHLQARDDSLSFQPSLLPSRSLLTRRQVESSPAQVDSKSQGEVAPVLRVLGQAGNTYVVAEGQDGIFLLDQHAAHERVLYERVTSEMRRGEPSVQTLMEAVAVDMPAAHLELLEEGWQDMEGYGFLLEPFGGTTYLLRAVPSIFRDSDPVKGLLEILEMASRESSVKGRREALAASIACHRAVRAGMNLSHEEMTEMVALLETVENPHTCPHGRPTMLHLSARELERQFGRR